MAKYPIKVTGEADPSVETTIRKVVDAFGRLTRGGPFEKIGKSFEGWNRSSRSMGEAWKALGSLGSQASGAAGGLGEAAEGASGLAMAAGGAALAVGAVAVGLAAAADKAIKFETAYSGAGREIGITSRLLGTTSRELQVMRGAANLAGVSNDQLTGSLQGLGQNLNDARWGRNNQVLALWTQMGLKIRYLKDGTVDTSAAMIDLAGVLQRYPAQTRGFIAAQLGVSGALPFLSQGPAKMRADMREYSDSMAAMTDKQIAESTRFQRSLTGLGEKWQALQNAFAERLVFPWADPLINKLSSLAGWFEKLINFKLTLGSGAQGGADYAAFALGGPLGALAALGMDSLINQGKTMFGDGGPGAPAAASAGRAISTGGGRIARGAGGALSDIGRYARDYLAAHGVRSDIALGIGAGITAEGGTPTAFNPAGGGHGALGIGQWRGARLRALIARYGPNPSKSQQMEFLLSELRGGDPGGHAVLGASSASSALGAYIRDFMRPGGGAAGDMRRGNAALAGGGQKVRVDIHLHGAPKGAVAHAAGGHGVDLGVHIGAQLGGAI